MFKDKLQGHTHTTTVTCSYKLGCAVNLVAYIHHPDKNILCAFKLLAFSYIQVCLIKKGRQSAQFILHSFYCFGNGGNRIIWIIHTCTYVQIALLAVTSECHSLYWGWLANNRQTASFSVSYISHGLTQYIDCIVVILKISFSLHLATSFPSGAHSFATDTQFFAFIIVQLQGLSAVDHVARLPLC